MRFRFAAFAAALLSMLAGAAPKARAQQPDSVPAPTARFLGRLLNSIDSMPVGSADIRLFFIDSTRVAHDRLGADSLEIFVDTARSRLVVSDSTGGFVVRRLAEGRYLLNIRRIGFGPLQGVLAVDTGAVGGVFSMQPTSILLSKIVIRERALDRLQDRLERVGFADRQHSGLSATFVGREDIAKTRANYIEDILSRYGIHEADVMLDRMPLTYEDVRKYPAETVLAIEVYRHNRPDEFNMTRSGPNMFDAGGQRNAMKPLVVIWTFIP